MNKRDPRQLEREELLFRYSSALQRGDFTTVEEVLLEAQHDPALDDQIADLNAAYETELNAAHTILSNNRRYREDQPVNISLNRNINRLPNSKRIPFTLTAAVLAVALISAVLLTLRGGGMRPSNLAAVEQSLSPTATSTALVSPSPTINITAQLAQATVTAPNAAIAVCASHARLNSQTFAHVRPSDSSTLSGQIPTGTIVEIWASGLPAPDDKTVSPIWTFIKADVDGTSVQGWIDLNGATQLDCAMSSGAVAVPVVLPATPVVLDSSIATPAGILCRVMLPPTAYVYSSPFPDDDGHPRQFTESTAVDVLEQDYRPANSYLWYFINLIGDTAPKFEGWVRADQTIPISQCPPPVRADLDSILLTATAIVDEATALAQPGATYPLSTPMPAVMELQPTICPPTPMATPTLIGAVALPGMDGMLLTATAIVAQATVLAQPPCEAGVPNATAFSLAATPTSALIDTRQAVLLTDAGSIPTGTTVMLIGASYDGVEWTYEISTLDRSISALVHELQLAPEGTFATPTLIPTVCPPDQVMNITSHLLEILSSPLQGSITIGTLTPGTVATVHRSEVESDNQTWLLITIEVTGSSVTGWVPALEVASVPCVSVEVAPSMTLDCAVFSTSESIIQVKNEPSETALNIGALPSGLVANVRDQKQSDDGYQWYFVTVRLDSAVVTGWIREDYTITVEPCPVIPADAATAVAPMFAPAASFTPTMVSP